MDMPCSKRAGYVDNNDKFDCVRLLGKYLVGTYIEW